MDGNHVWAENKQIVFAVDQEPFDDGGKWFCFLYPLMTLEGDRLQADPASFPNTGRVWWMIGDQKHQFAVPGSIWSGPIEEHPGWSRSKDNPRHNRFQAKKDAIRHGGGDLIEVLTLAHIEPTPDIVYKGLEIPLNKPPTQMVFLRGKQFVVGPLKATWDSERLSATFEGIVVRAINPDHPVMLHFTSSEFDVYARVESFSYEARKLDYASSPIPYTVHLTRKDWIQWEALLNASKVHDAFKDNELINWAVKSVDDFSLSRQERRQLNAFLEQVRLISTPSQDASFQRRLARLNAIANDVERTQQLGEEVAKVLAKGPFQALVEAHLESTVEASVQKEIQRRSKLIQAAIAEEERKLALCKEQQRKELADHAKELQEQTREHKAGLVKAEEQLKARANGLDIQERRIQSALTTLREDGEALASQWLAMFPMLGLTTPHSQSNIQSPLAPTINHPPRTPLAFPAFLQETRDATTTISAETDFLEQFVRVVADEGYLFEPNDLYNFHICAKTGYMTILAGHTGMGKSSLPRLYAQALGCQDEYLHLSVRPDWLDDRDLLGAFNAIARRFEPAAAGFSERLICAQLDLERQRGGIYLFCLDEMNLARVEHYFAQFLSTLEKPETERQIHLFGAGVVDASDPYAPYRTIELQDNIRFIGTVNIDETAFFFSPKVLDRAQVIVLQDADLGAPLPIPPDTPSPILPVLLESYQEWLKPAPPESASRTYLLEIDRILRQSRLGFGFRQFERMLTYLASSEGVLSTDQAIDFQLMQVALPRLRRTAPHFSDTLEALLDKIDDTKYPRSAEMLNRIKESEAEDDFFQLI